MCLYFSSSISRFCSYYGAQQTVDKTATAKVNEVHRSDSNSESLSTMFSPPSGSGCSSPGPLTHGSISVSEDGSWSMFSCNTGFRLHGPSMLYCKGHTWNSTKPVCKGVHGKLSAVTEIVWHLRQCYCFFCSNISRLISLLSVLNL